MAWEMIAGAVPNVPNDTVTCNIEALDVVLGREPDDTVTCNSRELPTLSSGENAEILVVGIP